jgi:hypothetical protein
MSIDSEQLRLCVIRPTLQYLNSWSPAAENLLLGTAAQESQMGKYLKQIGGPAFGIYQMEPATHNDLWANFIEFRPELKKNVMDLASSTFKNTPLELIANLAYATAMTRVFYLRVKELLPKPADIDGLAFYWKRHYNTNLGKGTVNEFKENYRRFVK